MTLIKAWMRPESPPESRVADPRVVSCRAYEDGGVIGEITRREDGSFGCRLQAWVAWRDAGSSIRSHSWYPIRQTGVIADSLATAQQLADEYARDSDLSPHGPWASAV
jgi:hypothetical protein